MGLVGREAGATDLVTWSRMRHSMRAFAPDHWILIILSAQLIFFSLLLKIKNKLYRALTLSVDGPGRVSMWPTCAGLVGL